MQGHSACSFAQTALDTNSHRTTSISLSLIVSKAVVVVLAAEGRSLRGYHEPVLSWLPTFYSTVVCVTGIERTTFVIGPDGRIVRIFPKVQVEGHAHAVLAAVQEAQEKPSP